MYTKDAKGYMRRRMRTPDGRQHTIYEHSEVVEQALGRPLRSDEHVHHRNGKRDDNRLDNLEVTSNAEHKRLHNLETYGEPNPLITIMCSWCNAPFLRRRIDDKASRRKGYQPVCSPTCHAQRMLYMRWHTTTTSSPYRGG